MQQLGLTLTEDDIHAMMKSVGIGPYGKISYTGGHGLLSRGVPMGVSGGRGLLSRGVPRDVSGGRGM